MLQFRGLGELCVQCGDEARHLFLEGFAVVLDCLGADVAASLWTIGDDTSSWWKTEVARSVWSILLVELNSKSYPQSYP